MPGPTKPSPTPVTPSGLQTSSLTEKAPEEDRSGRIALTASWIAAGAAIVSAVVSSLIVSNLAVSLSTSQATSETTRSKAEFLRGQRQQVYATIVTDERRVRLAEVKSREFVNEKKGSRKSYEGFQETLNTHLTTLRADRDSTQIIGSKAVREALEDLVKSHNAMQDSIDLQYQDTILKRGPDTGKAARVQQIKDIDAKRLLLYDVARKDLDSE